MKKREQLQMWLLCFFEGIIGQKRFQVFVKMAVIIIAILAVMKTVGRVGEVRSCFPDAHNLQCLPAADAGTDFKITLHSTRGDAIVGRQLLNRKTKCIVLEASLQDFAYHMYRVYGSVVVVDELGKILTKNIDARFEIGCLLYLTYNAWRQQVTKREYITLIL